MAMPDAVNTKWISSLPDIPLTKAILSPEATAAKNALRRQSTPVPVITSSVVPKKAPDAVEPHPEGNDVTWGIFKNEATFKEMHIC